MVIYANHIRDFLCFLFQHILQLSISDNAANLEQEVTQSLSPYLRVICPGCALPVYVCLCDVIPSSRWNLHTHLLVLQHTHELKHKSRLSRCCPVAFSLVMW
ncbi:hypothetical protein M758_UG245600 [Ceratodon purpureus]|nr:hypothetical protein M758_UG245600 [Ceratodon purpureus]